MKTLIDIINLMDSQLKIDTGNEEYLIYYTSNKNRKYKAYVPYNYKRNNRLKRDYDADYRDIKIAINEIHKKVHDDRYCFPE